VVTRWERDPFTLASINLDSVEALGQTFAKDNAPTLTRKAIDAERDASGEAHVVIRDQSRAGDRDPDGDAVRHDRERPRRAPHPDERGRGVGDRTQRRGRRGSGLPGWCGVTEATPWRPEHGRLATARLTEWIAAKQTSSPAREVREVRPVRWPEPSERFETRPPRIGRS
jgi:type III restriction enzyme